MKGEDKCYVCGREHSQGYNNKDFKTLPIQFRWCCNCLSHATLIVNWGLEALIKRFKEDHNFFLRRAFTKRAKRLNELMTLA